jgi:hypothetical protein
MKVRVSFLLLALFLLSIASPAPAIPPEYVGTWTGTASLATQNYGYLTKTVTITVTSNSQQVFKGAYNVQNGELTGNLSGCLIGSKVYLTGNYFVGEGTVSYDSVKKKYQIKGCWQYVGSSPPYAYTAYFHVFK